MRRCQPCRLLGVLLVVVSQAVVLVAVPLGLCCRDMRSGPMACCAAGGGQDGAAGCAMHRLPSGQAPDGGGHACHLCRVHDMAASALLVGLIGLPAGGAAVLPDLSPAGRVYLAATTLATPSSRRFSPPPRGTV